jgi:hypothetical protein
MLNKFIRLVTYPYYLIRNVWPVWYFILNSESKKYYMQNFPNLNGLQKKIVSEFKENGIVITHIDELFPGKNLLPELQSFVNKNRNNGEIRSGKPFLMSLLPLPPVLDLSNPFIKLALTSEVINIVNSYMGLCVKLFDFSLDITLPVGKDASPFRSQNWHRDPGDKKMCKFFLYLNDVEEESGPFVYVPKSQYGGKWRRIFPQRPPRGYYPPPDEVEKMIPKSDIKVCTGKAGTIIFADTTGYATLKERHMFTAGFDSLASLRPIGYKLPVSYDIFLKNIENLDPAVHYSLTKK